MKKSSDEEFYMLLHGIAVPKQLNVYQDVCILRNISNPWLRDHQKYQTQK